MALSSILGYAAAKHKYSDTRLCGWIVASTLLEGDIPSTYKSSTTTLGIAYAELTRQISVRTESTNSARALPATIVANTQACLLDSKVQLLNALSNIHGAYGSF